MLWPRFALVLLPGILFGCSSGPQPLPPANQRELKEIHEIYQHFVKSEGKPPAELSDIARTQYEGTYPGAVQALQEGKYLVVFGVAGKDSGTVLAYEKDAPAQGGAVLLADGTVRTMTADQFKKARPGP